MLELERLGVRVVSGRLGRNGGGDDDDGDGSEGGDSEGGAVGGGNSGGNKMNNNNMGNMGGNMGGVSLLTIDYYFFYTESISSHDYNGILACLFSDGKYGNG